MFGTDSSGNFFSCSAVPQATALPLTPLMQMYFAQLLQINILYSTENFSFSPTHVCACTNAWHSFSHACMHVHTPKKNISFIHVHAHVRMPTHTLCVLPHVFFFTGRHHGLRLTLIGDIWADIVIYIVWNQKLE